MIRFVIYRDGERINGFKAEGHAGFADPGEDIVCAGVSAVSIGTVNAITELLKVPLDYRMEDNGFLSANVPAIEDKQIADQVQLLLSAMVLTLQSIEETYGQYMQVKTKQRRSIS